VRGVLVLVGVGAIALGVDTRVLSKLSSAQTANIESGLARKLGASQAMNDTTARTGTMGELILPVEGTLPPLNGLGPWFNSKPLAREQLKGNVVVIDFWTYSCINCLRSLPYLKAWNAKYRQDGLVIIGVHAPEFAFERDPANVSKAIKDLGVTYPVAIDNRYVLWNALKNNYWPAHYFIDAQGRIRFHHFGEGEYAMSERVIRQLLAEAGHAPKDAAMAQANASGAEAAAASNEIGSPETYIGYARADRFASPSGLVHDQSKTYSPAPLLLNQWSLEGQWTDSKQSARSSAPGAKISFRFHARDLHLVLGSGTGKAIRYRVTLDGERIGSDGGIDATNGMGVVKDQRLYQLIRQKGPIRDRTFTIEFLDAGADAFSFTFG
jgi:thiol-disulfide isomerase/thioredoxin